MKKLVSKIKDAIKTAFNFLKRKLSHLFDIIKFNVINLYNIITRKTVRLAKKRVKQDRIRDYLYIYEYSPGRHNDFLKANKGTTDLKLQLQTETQNLKKEIQNLSQVDNELYEVNQKALKTELEQLKDLELKRFNLALELEKAINKLDLENEREVRKFHHQKEYDANAVYEIVKKRNDKVQELTLQYVKDSKVLFDTYEKLNLINYLTTEELYKTRAHKIMPKLRKGLTYKQRKVLMGLLFIAPWAIGFALFFVFPFVQSLYYSFFKLDLSEGRIDLTFVGFKNYIYAFDEHTVGSTSFKIELLETLKDALINLPVLLIFSLFIAVLLNQEFRGRAVVRAIFFIPVILNSTVVAQLMGKGDLFTGILMSDTDIPPIFDLNMYLVNMGIGTGLVGLVVDLITRIYDILTLAGIPILLFLAAIQSVPNHLYEAATIEGATGYEMFWLITLPNVSVHIVTVTIYAIVDTFLTSNVSDIIVRTFRSEKGLSSAMSWIYVAAILLLLLLLFLIAKIFKIGESHYEK